MAEINWLDLKQASVVSGKSDRTLRRWVQSNKLPHKRVDGKIFVNLATHGYAMPIDEPDITDDTPTKKEYEQLQARLDDALSERDYLRQALAAALSKIPQLSAQSSEPGRRTWKFWQW